jgi:hypothetical protein
MGRRLLFQLIGIIIFVIILWRLDLRVVYSVIVDADLVLLLPSLIMVVPFVLLKALRWKYLLRMQEFNYDFGNCTLALSWNILLIILFFLLLFVLILFIFTNEFAGRAIMNVLYKVVLPKKSKESALAFSITFLFISNISTCLIGLAAWFKKPLDIKT